MSHIVRLAVLAAFPTMATPLFSQTATCNNSPFNVGYGGDSVTTLSIQSGSSCSAPLNWNSGAIESVQVEKPATHGTGRAGRNAWGYTSKAGYTGSDSFSFRIRRGGRSPDSVVTVHVTVTQ